VSKKPRGREPAATSLKRVRGLIEELRDLDRQHELHEWLYSNLPDRLRAKGCNPAGAAPAPDPLLICREAVHELQERLYPKQRDRILRDLEGETAWRQMQADRAVEIEVSKAHRKGSTMRFVGQHPSAFAVASEKLARAGIKRSPGAVQAADRRIKKRRREMELEMANAVRRLPTRRSRSEAGKKLQKKLIEQMKKSRDHQE
jgi:hypothetical protein